RKRLLLAHHHAIAVSARGEIASFDERGHTFVLDGTEAEIVHAAPEEIPERRRHGGGLPAEQRGGEIEIMNGIRVPGTDVRARPLETGEATRAVAYASHLPAPDAVPHELGYRMEADDVANLKHAVGRSHDVPQLAAFGKRQRYRLLDEAILAGPEALHRNRLV